MSHPSGRRPTTQALIGFGAIALTLLLLQIVQSRLFGATLTYYFAFMLISLAMLGLAAGGVAVRVFPRLIPADLLWTRVSRLCVAMGASIFVGTVGTIAILTRIDFGSYVDLYSHTPLALMAVFWLTFPAFFLGGLVVSGVLAAHRHMFGRLYAIDLSSAAAGCVIALGLLEVITPVEALLSVASVVPMVSAVAFAREAGNRRLAFESMAAAAMTLVLSIGFVSNRAVARPRHVAFPANEVLSEWNAMSAVRVYPTRFFTWSLSPFYKGRQFEMRDLIIDGMGGTPIVRFDGQADELAGYEYLAADLTALPHRLVPENARQLIIGPGGGVDVLQAVRAGRKDLTLVEINPLVGRVVNDDLEMFSGAPYRLPGVHTVYDNGRTFVKRAREHWDLLTLTWVDTGGSATALAFSENYLYTVEAFREYLSHLTTNGIVAFLRAWNTGVRVDSLRGVSVAMEALRRSGAARPQDHIVIAASKSPFFARDMCLVLISPAPFAAAAVAEAEAFLAQYGFVAVWLPNVSVASDSLPADMRDIAQLMSQIVTTSEPDRLYRESSYDIAPSTDDNPFYFVERSGPHREAGIGVSQLSFYVAILAGLVGPFLLAPVLSVRRQERKAADFVALLYFALLGLAFILVEIEFFHLFALVLGKPTLTLAVVLGSLLVFSGAGSVFGARIAVGSDAGVIVAFGLLVVQLFVFGAFGTWMMSEIVDFTMAARVLVTAALIAPVAFCMGFPMAAGMRLIREREDLVLWGWAVNGAVSVFASVLAIYLAIHVGIGRTFMVGCAGYAGAWLLFHVQRRFQRDKSR